MFFSLMRVHVWLNSRYAPLGFQTSFPTPLPYIEIKQCIVSVHQQGYLSLSWRGRQYWPKRQRSWQHGRGVYGYGQHVNNRISWQGRFQIHGLTPPALELAASAWSCNPANSQSELWGDDLEQCPQTVFIRGVNFSTSRWWIPNLTNHFHNVSSYGKYDF